jgi:hypothetical protein
VGPGNPPPHRPFDDRIQETYSHVAAEVETRLREGLQDRWLKAVADSPLRPAWRETPT